jgi:hypothetical protein
MALARDYRIDAIRSIALAPLGAPPEMTAIQDVIDRWLSQSALPVVAYTAYQPGAAAETD